MGVCLDPHLLAEQDRVARAAQHGFGLLHEPVVSLQVVRRPVHDDSFLAIQRDPVLRVREVLAHDPPVDTVLRRQRAGD